MTYLKGSPQGTHGLLLVEDCPNVRTVAKLRCPCGVEFSCRLQDARSGTQTKSCGCRRQGDRDWRPPRNRRWLVRTVLNNMECRAWDRSGRNPEYVNIGICNEWNRKLHPRGVASRAFVEWAMQQPGWNLPMSSIDRINPAGNYEPDNCRFISLSENSRLGGIGNRNDPRVFFSG